jgi:hypothetical protein
MRVQYVQSGLSLEFFRILVCCCFYFPTTMALMYFYGSAFHVNKLRLKRVVCANAPEVVGVGRIERVSICPLLHQRHTETNTHTQWAQWEGGARKHDEKSEDGPDERPKADRVTEVGLS